MSSSTWVSLDLDDLLVDFLTPFLARLNPIAGTSYTRRDIVSTDWCHCVDAAGRRAHKHHALSAVERMVLGKDLLSLKVQPGVINGMHRLKEIGIRFVINTHRRYPAFSDTVNASFAAQTHRWVETNLGEWVDEIEIVGTSAAKLEVCRHYRAIAHCDDRITNLTRIAEDAQTHALLLSAPWNSDAPAPSQSPPLPSWVTPATRPSARPFAETLSAPLANPPRRGQVFRARSIEHMFDALTSVVTVLA